MAFTTSRLSRSSRTRLISVEAKPSRNRSRSASRHLAHGAGCRGVVHGGSDELLAGLKSIFGVKRRCGALASHLVRRHRGIEHPDHAVLERRQFAGPAAVTSTAKRANLTIEVALHDIPELEVRCHALFQSDRAGFGIDVERSF